MKIGGESSKGAEIIVFERTEFQNGFGAGLRDDLRIAISFTELVESVLIKSRIQQCSTNAFPYRWSKGVVKMSDALRVGAYGIVNEDLKHLDKHWPIPRIFVEAWRFNSRWFNAGTTRRSVCGTEVLDPCIRCVNSMRVVGHRWRSGRSRKTRRECQIPRYEEWCQDT